MRSSGVRALALGLLCALAAAHQGTAQIGGIKAGTFGDRHWKPPVANAAALPSTGNAVADTRRVLDTGEEYWWNGSAWVDAGVQGPPGPAGPTGAAGAQGPAGNTVRNGTGAPISGLGTSGDFYIDNAAAAIYGPKASGAWGSPTSLVGPAGATGPTGSAGAQGATGPQGETGPSGATGPAGSTGAAGVNGSTWYSGSGAPSIGTGANGDYYFRTETGDVYGNTAGSWAIIANLTGPQGSTGATGPTGSAGVTGSTGATGPTGPPGAAGSDGIPRTIQDEGVDLNQRLKVNLTGAGVTCADNSGSGRTDCNIPNNYLPTNPQSPGSVAATSVQIVQAGTGLWQPAVNVLGLAAAGVEALRLNTASSGVNYLDVTPSATGVRVKVAVAGSDSNAGIDFVAKGNGPNGKLFTFTNGAVGWDIKQSGSFENYGATGGQVFISGAQASSSIPVYTFISDTDTGIGKAGSDQLSLIVGGVETVRISSTGTRVDSIQFVPRTSPPVTCGNAGTEGVMYTDSSHALCYCNGTSWFNMTPLDGGSCS